LENHADLTRHAYECLILNRKEMFEHKGIPVLAFEDTNAFHAWLKKNHKQETAVWIRIYKVQSGFESITRQALIDTVLCWGWIDGLVNKYDEVSYLLRISMRRPKSIWSKINAAKVEELMASGLMQPSGLEQVNKAKADGRWAMAYEPPSKMEVPKAFLQMIKKDKAAFVFYNTLSKTDTYAIAFKIATVKAEKRKDKMLQIVEMLKKQKAFYP
jgi:uncharacterized protein YdeI (YjbR/CyaY-like superfamily)